MPNIQLDGRESKFIVTDYKFGQYELLYSSAEILTYAIFDNSPVLVLYANAGQTVEFVLKNVVATPKVFGGAAINTETYLTRVKQLAYQLGFILFPLTDLSPSILKYPTPKPAKPASSSSPLAR